MSHNASKVECNLLYNDGEPVFQLLSLLNLFKQSGLLIANCLRNKTKSLIIPIIAHFQFQNLQNENATLKQRLEELAAALQKPEDKWGEERRTDRDEERVERGVQGAESLRGEGEGRVRATEERERRGDLIRTPREAGVGEELLLVQGEKGEKLEEEVERYRRGEAEGWQKDREKQERGEEKQDAGVTNSSGAEADVPVAEETAGPLPGPDVEPLTLRLQEAQQETDRQTQVAQDLRSKLGEQSKRTWEAEQRLVVLEAELQHLKKAAENLAEARRQIEVGGLRWRERESKFGYLFPISIQSRLLKKRKNSEMKS